MKYFFKINASENCLILNFGIRKNNFKNIDDTSKNHHYSF